MTVKCFLVEPSGRVRLYLRRYASKSGTCCKKRSYHDARVLITVVPCSVVNGLLTHEELKVEDQDSRWPKACGECGAVFDEEDPRQVFSEEIYVDAQGKEYALADNVPGMMYDARWLHDVKGFLGPDGRSLHVVCPDGHAWCIDSRAKNCTMPKDENHKCWIRHGDPPKITVDKQGVTCSAGAGSIDTGAYHGFLRDGKFT